MAQLLQFFDEFDNLASLSVSVEEVFLVDMDDNDLLYTTNKAGEIERSCSGKGLAIADRCVICDDGSVHSYGQIRDFVEGPCSLNRRLTIRDKKLRRLCESRGATRKYVPGGIYPIIPMGYIAVADFNMSGTNWFLLPINVARTLTLDKYEGHYGQNLAEVIKCYDEIWGEA